MPELMDMLDGLFTAHPPEYFFGGGIIGKHFDIGRGPAAAADHCYFVILLMHCNKNVLPGLLDRTNL